MTGGYYKKLNDIVIVQEKINDIKFVLPKKIKLILKRN